MKRITSRMLSQRHSTIGDRHDPTSCLATTLDEVRNGHKRKIILLQHFDLELRLNGRRVAYGEDVPAKLLKLTGLTPDQLLRAYDRVHPYFDDPFGHLSMYE